MVVMPSTCPECGASGGEPHVQPCSFQETYDAARNPLIEWLVSLPAEYERLKANARRTGSPYRATANADGDAARP
jgi:hypothetical protein